MIEFIIVILFWSLPAIITYFVVKNKGSNKENRKLNKQIKELRNELGKLSSINYTLSNDNESLRRTSINQHVQYKEKKENSPNASRIKSLSNHTSSSLAKDSLDDSSIPLTKKQRKLEEEYKTLKIKEKELNHQVKDLNKLVNSLNIKISNLEGNNKFLSGVNEETSKRNNSLYDKVRELERKLELDSQDRLDPSSINFMHEFGYYEYNHPAETSVELKSELEDIRISYKSMISEKTAAEAMSNLSFEGSRAKGKKLTNDLMRLMLSAYNAEVENALKSVRSGNVDPAIKRLDRAKNRIEKCGTLINLKINEDFHKLRMEEILIASKHLQALAYEKELEKEARSKERELEKLEKEAQKQRDIWEEEIKKQKDHYNNAINSLEQNKDYKEAEKLKK